MKQLVQAQQSVDIYFFRHGQSIYQCQRLVAGDNEYGLSGLGKVQTHRISKNIRTIAFDCVISSDLRRAIETYRIIHNYLKNPPAPSSIVYTHLLREKDQGVLKNKPLSILKVFDQDRQHCFEGGESWDDVQFRVQSLVNGIACHYLNDPLIRPNSNSQPLIDSLPPFQPKPRYSVLLLTHYGFIREFFHLMKIAGCEEEMNPGIAIEDNGYNNLTKYYAQNATLFQIQLKVSVEQWKFDIIAMNSRVQQYRPFFNEDFPQ